MKSLLQIALTLSVATSAFCQAHAHDDIAAQSSSKHQAYIMVVGPGLDNDRASKNVYLQCQDLAQALKKRSPTDVIVHDNFSLPRLQQEVSRLKNRHGDNLHLTCIVNAHGYDVGGNFKTLTHHGLVTDVQLKSVLEGCDTTLALLTCHAGAFVDDSDKLEVFGGSSNSTPLYEHHFQNWLSAAKSAPSLASAEDFSKTWGASLGRFSPCPQKQYPFWNSTMVGNCVVGTKIQPKKP